MFIDRGFALLATALLPLSIPVAVIAQPNDIPLRSWSAPPYWSQPAPAGTRSSLRSGGLDMAATAIEPRSDDSIEQLVFIGITPCRLVDTRDPTLPPPFGAPALSGAQVRTITAPANTRCGIPAGAKAYSLNFTAVPKGPLAYLTTWPAGATQPFVSTLNSFTSTVVANAAIVPAGVNGAISVYVTDSTDLVIDVNGYFAPASSGGYSFYTVSPCRVEDTRNPTGVFGGPALAPGEPRSFPIPQAVCGSLSTAVAYSLNATVVPAGALGFLALWPAGGAQPLVSTLNAWDGMVTSNAAIVPAGSNGGISAYATESTHLILDINGYFAP